MITAKKLIEALQKVPEDTVVCVDGHPFGFKYSGLNIKYIGPLEAKKILGNTEEPTIYDYHELAKPKEMKIFLLGTK